MNDRSDPARVDPRLIQPFPQGGPLVRLAYQELSIAANGTSDEKATLGDPSWLPRPWDPATCRDPQLRQQVWTWLDEVATWLNTDHTWDVNHFVPACWPHHPHLIHELATVADQRLRAGHALHGDALEEWHRYCLPAFLDRVHARTRNHCEDGHQPWPAKSRHTRYTNDTNDRISAFTADTQSINTAGTPAAPPTKNSLGAARPAGMPRLGIVNLDTGEITEA